MSVQCHLNKGGMLVYKGRLGPKPLLSSSLMLILAASEQYEHDIKRYC